MPDILSKTNQPFKNKAAVTTAINRDSLLNHEAVEIRPGEWVGREIWLSDAELADLEPDEIKEPVPEFFPRDIFCPSCGESFHETTEAYCPDLAANSSMMRLKELYVSYGWNDVPPDPTAGYGVLECPGCGSAMAPDGRLKVV